MLQECNQLQTTYQFVAAYGQKSDPTRTLEQESTARESRLLGGVRLTRDHLERAHRCYPQWSCTTEENQPRCIKGYLGSPHQARLEEKALAWKGPSLDEKPAWSPASAGGPAPSAPQKLDRAARQGAWT
jgi:hypothetical protein